MWNTLRSWWKSKGRPRVSRPRGLWSRRLLWLERLEERTLLSGEPLPFTAFQTAHADGRLSLPDQVDLYRVTLQQADSVSIAVSSQASGGALQSVLRVFDSSGKPLALDNQEGGDPSLTFQATAAGDYLIGVSSAGNDAYNPNDPNTDRGGQTTGLFALDLRRTPETQLVADVAGSSFRLGASTAVPGDVVPVQFTVENRGGADPGNFQVKLLLANNQLFNNPTVVKSFTRANLIADATGQRFSAPAGFSVTVPADQTSGPLFVGLQIIPDPTLPDAGLPDKSGVHRGVDWEPLTVLTPVPSGQHDLSQADASLNTQATGNLLTPGQGDSYTFTVTAGQGSGRVTAAVTATSGTLVPRLVLKGPLGAASGPGGATVVPLNGNGYAGLHFNLDGYVPPDSQGAAGPSSYLESVNQTLAIFSPAATGTSQVSDSFSHFWSLGGLAPVDDSGSYSDPVLTYDDNVPGQTPATGRFIVCDQNVDFNTGASVLDIAVSTSAKPATLTAADWNFYQINTTEAGFFTDYPGNLGFNRDALIVTLNQLDLAGSASHAQVNAINIQDLVSGVAPDQLRFSQSDVNDLSLRAATEHDAAAGDPQWLVSETGDGQHINVYKMTDVLSASPTFTLTQLAVHPYTNISVVPPLQPDGSAVTTNIDSRIQKAAEANGMLVAAHAVSLSPTEDAAQWYAIDVSSGTPVLQQQGDVSLGDNTYASYPSIDISPSGAVGMTFMDSGIAAGQYPSMYVTGRLPGDPAGQMAVPVLVAAGAGQTNYHDFAGGRAGDLSGINIDPVNGSFWAVNEFANQDTSGANWDTAIANFNLASGPGGASVVPLNGSGYAGLHFNLDGYVPPDSQGAAGPSSYLESVNQTIAIFSPAATGTSQVSDSFSHFWSLGGLAPVDDSGSYSDPVLTYDDNVPGQTAATGRFIVCDQNVDFNTGASVLDIAVSTSANPATLTAADWNFYQINTTEAGFFTDYPGNLGFNRDALIVTLNQLDLAGSASHAQVNAINIQDLVSGVAPDQLRFSQSDVNDLSLRAATEHDAAAGDPQWLVSETGDGHHINVYKMTDVLSAAPTFSLTQLAVHPYTEISPAKPYVDVARPLQPDGSAVTTNIDSNIQKAAEANGTLVAAHAVALSTTEEAAQWYMIDVASGTPVLKQQGDVTLGDNTYASYPAIDISPSGAVGLTFMDSGTAKGRYLSMYVTGRLPGDPTGQMATPVLVPAGAGQANYHDFTGGRAGDLSGINIDPVNGSFWAVNEFANGITSGANWGTAIANFNLTSNASSDGMTTPGLSGHVLMQSDTGTIVQHLQPGTYVLTVSAQSGSGSYRLITDFVQANPPLNSAPVGGTPSAVVVADLNGDGIPDLTTASFSDNTVSVLLGNGDGSFQPQRTFAVGQLGQNTGSLAVADLNGDGKLDLIVADTYGAAVDVLLGNGDGTFQPTQVFPAGKYPGAVAVADVNGDGKPDIVVTNPGNNTVSVLLNTTVPGASGLSFASPQAFKVGSDPFSVAVADLNGDGKPDIVTANYTSYTDNTGYLHILAGTVSVLLNTTAPGADLPGFAFQQTYAVGYSPGVVAVADVNGDGKPDLLVANFQGNNAQSGGLSVLLGNGNGTFQSQQPFNTGFVPFSMAVGDLNGDGKLDVIVGNFGAHTESVLLNTTPTGAPTAFFQAPQSFPLGFYPGAVAVADVNGDGKADIVVTNSGSGFNPGSSVYVLLGNGDGSLQAPPAISAGAVPQAVVVKDVNGDGNPDLLTANTQDNTVSVLLGDGDGSFQTGQTVATGHFPQALAVADVNGDGKPDLVVANAGDGTVSVLLGNGDGTFQDSPRFLAQHSFKGGAYPIAVQVADVNGDGIPDLIVANAGDNTVGVLLGKGDGTFGAQQTFDLHYGPPGARDFGPQSLTVADVNGDGKPDLIVVNGGYAYGGYKYPGSTVSVLLNTTPKGAPTASFQAPQSFFAGYYPTSVAVADIHGDGKPPDLVVGHYLPPGGFLDYSGYPGNQVSVLPGNGDGTFQAPQNLFTGTDPSSVTAINSEGQPSIIAANFRSNSVTVLGGDGKGKFSTSQAVGAGFTPTAVNVADVNGDGKPDLVVGNEFGGTFTVLLGNSDGTFTQATPGREAGRRNTPYLANLSGHPDGTLDSVVLDRAGNLRFRRGLSGSANQFKPPVTLNSDRPARDLTLLHTPSGPAIAVVDSGYDETLSSPDHLVYTVSVYTVAADGKLHRTTAFSTPLLPTRIAAADLTGNGLDDIVVADALDNSIQVAYQQSDGSFSAPLTLPTDEAPSDITLVPVQNPKGLPDIVVSNQASGDVTVFLNDPKHTFATSYPFRAGLGPYGLDASGTAVVSQEQSVSLAAGDFMGHGRNDLVVINRGSRSFSVLASDGNGGFANPSAALTTDFGALTNAQPGPAVAFQVAAKTYLAILMENPEGGVGSVWVYADDGHGHFTLLPPVFAGADPTGLTAVPGVHGFDLLVGNPFGDILRLIDNGDGTFAPASLSGDHATLDVTSGLPDVLLADQKDNVVSVQAPTTNGTTFQQVQTVPTATTETSLAPGAVHWMVVDGSAGTPYYAVTMGTGSNSMQVARVASVDASGVPTFADKGVTDYAVGSEPVGVTIADLNGDGIPDMIVANQGSNDVSVLFGSLDSTTGFWQGTPGPRLATGGVGPVSTALRDVNGDGIPDLVVTNGQSGTLTVLPGRGLGFFDDRNPEVVSFGTPVGPGHIDPSGRGVVATEDGRLLGFNLNNLARGASTLFTPPEGEPINAVQAMSDGTVFVALSGGAVEELKPEGLNGELAVSETFASLSGIPSNPSALEVLDTPSGPEVLVTNAGGDTIFVFTPSSVAESVDVLLPALQVPGTPTAEFTTSSDQLLTPSVTLVAANLVLPNQNAVNLTAEEQAEMFVSSAFTARRPASLEGEDTAGDRGADDSGIDVDERLRQLDLYEPTPNPDRDGPSADRAAPPPIRAVLAFGEVDELLAALPATPLPNPAETPVPAVLAVPEVSAATHLIGEADELVPVCPATPVAIEGARAVESPGRPAAVVATPATGDTDAAFLLPPRGWEHSLPFLAVAAGGLGLWLRENAALPGKRPEEREMDARR